MLCLELALTKHTPRVLNVGLRLLNLPAGGLLLAAILADPTTTNVAPWRAITQIHLLVYYSSTFSSATPFLQQSLPPQHPLRPCLRMDISHRRPSPQNSLPSAPSRPQSPPRNLILASIHCQLDIQHLPKDRRQDRSPLEPLSPLQRSDLCHSQEHHNLKRPPPCLTSILFVICSVFIVICSTNVYTFHRPSSQRHFCPGLLAAPVFFRGDSRENTSFPSSRRLAFSVSTRNSGFLMMPTDVGFLLNSDPQAYALATEGATLRFRQCWSVD